MTTVRILKTSLLLTAIAVFCCATSRAQSVQATLPAAAQAFTASAIEIQETGAELNPLLHASVDALDQDIYDTTETDYFGARVRVAYSNQSAVASIDLPYALLRALPGGPVKVAIIDTGIDPTNAALAPLIVDGYDFTRNLPGDGSELIDLDQSTVAILDGRNRHNATPVRLNQSTVAILDQSTVAILDSLNLPKAFGHGTMVAGLVHLVAPQAMIMPLKAFKADGSSKISDIARAVRYAVDHGANVINMSFSTEASSSELADAIDYATSHGVICVASSGNDGENEAVYPAAMGDVIGVGSINHLGVRSEFSNYGPSARTSGPGEALVTFYPGNYYAAVWGTSFSTALVSGEAALLAGLPSDDNQVSRMQDALTSGKKADQGMGESSMDVLSSVSFYLGDH